MDFEKIKAFVGNWIVKDDRCMPVFMTPLDLQEFIEEWEKQRDDDL